MKPTNEIAIGFYINAKKHKEISSWCLQKNITMDALCRTALYHFFFQITTLNKNKELYFYEKTRQIYPY